jgi:hypothetical protein
MARSEPHRVALRVYKHLLQINADFDQVSRALRGFGRNRLTEPLKRKLKPREKIRVPKF